MNCVKMIRKILAAGKKLLQCPPKMEANFQEILINQGRMMCAAIQNYNGLAYSDQKWSQNKVCFFRI